MSTKDNWDDESSDEEGDLPHASLKGDTPPAPLFKGEINPLEEYHETQFVDDDDGIPPEEGGVGEDPPEDSDDYDGGAWGDPPDDYDDELDNYDKKLGRYVAFR